MYVRANVGTIYGDNEHEFTGETRLVQLGKLSNLSNTYEMDDIANTTSFVNLYEATK